MRSNHRTWRSMQCLSVSLCAASSLALACSSDPSTPSGAGGVASAGASGSTLQAGGGGGTPAGGSGGALGHAGSGGVSGAAAAGGGGASGGAAAGGGNAGASAAGSAGVSGSGGATSSAFELTSSAFTNNGPIPDVNSCAGANTSPALAWGPGDHTPKAYAIVLRDTTNGFTHWVLWDIPPSTTSLPAGLSTQAEPATPSGAKQVSFAGNGYQGPCPSGQKHIYEFRLHALKVATVPGVTPSSKPDAVKKALENNSDGSTVLLGNSSAAKP